MDCRTARLLLDIARPQLAELDATEAEALKAHLSGCLECEFLSQADEQIAKTMRSVPVPDGLRERLVDRVTAERRRLRRRWAIRTGVQAVAVAAAVLLAVGLSARLFRPAPLGIDLDQEAYSFSMQATGTAASPERVEEWFRDNYHQEMVAPRDFKQRSLNYALLAHYCMADYKGKRVPHLVFVTPQGKDRAIVYILSAKEFDVQRLTQTSHASGGVVAELHQDGNIIYLVKYTGNSLDPFLIATPDVG
jgi:hypothetical protein